MSSISDSKCSAHGQSLAVKWPALLAAGTVATLAASQSQAGISYTPLDLYVDSSGVLGPSSVTLQAPWIGSATNDYKNDFTFTASTTGTNNGLTIGKPPGASGTYAIGQIVNVLTNTSSGVTTLPAAYSLGASISPASSPATTYSTIVSGSSSKPLRLLSADGTTGAFTEAAGMEYIGFFQNGVSTYQAGWISFQTLSTTADPGGAVSAHITGIALQSDIATPLAAGTVPEPASLGLLAMGSVGLLNYRRRKPQV